MQEGRCGGWSFVSVEGSLLAERPYEWHVGAASTRNQLLTTIETNPDKAVKAYQTGNLVGGLPHKDQPCLHH